MKRISFNDKELSNVHPKDLMNFVSMVYSDDRFKKGHLFVNKLTKEDCMDNGNMTTIKITFQHFKPKENVLGYKFEWVSYRAKEFACSNNRIVKVIE